MITREKLIAETRKYVRATCPHFSEADHVFTCNHLIAVMTRIALPAKKRNGRVAGSKMRIKKERASREALS